MFRFGHLYHERVNCTMKKQKESYEIKKGNLYEEMYFFNKYIKNKLQ